MIKVYSKSGLLLNVIYSLDDFNEGNRIDITDPSQALQCAIMKAEKGKVFKPHKHLNRKCDIHIQEAFIILKGKGKLRIYDFDDSPIGNYPLKEGDLTVLLQGGHSLEIEEDCMLYELKNGPYEGQSKDKWFLDVL
jgi:mannose-6-phosphate isomerase-like protein (cupin superfamily)